MQLFLNNCYVVFIWNWDVFHPALDWGSPAWNNGISLKKDQNVPANATSRGEF